MNDAEQLLLWRWSTIVQMTSLAMATVFFVLLARSSRRTELRSWAWAWFASFFALAVTSMYWLLQPLAPLLLIRVLYLGAKALFVVLLIQGASKMARPGAPWYSPKQVAIAVAIYAIAGAALFQGLNNIGILQHASMAIALLGFALVTWQSGAAGISWLVAGITVRGALAAVEAAAYLLQVYPLESSAGMWLNRAAVTFLPISSSFDTAAEWLLVLGCVLAVSDRSRRELQDANRDLMAAQEDLRRLADRDPLTALVNRRSLPEIFRAMQPRGALMLFFDLDGFKKINDVHGHAAGDACLKLFASALRDSFRPDDHVIRYGGDEFLVVANGLDQPAAQDRVDEVRKRMLRTVGGELMCKFSVGMAVLEPGGHPEAALEAADAQMYKAKNRVIA
jgi:diguanylate cyclase (GGDEF)-like protein